MTRTRRGRKTTGALALVAVGTAAMVLAGAAMADRWPAGRALVDQVVPELPIPVIVRVAVASLPAGHAELPPAAPDPLEVHGRFADPATLFDVPHPVLTSPREITSVIGEDGSPVYAAEDQLLVYLAPGLGVGGTEDVMRAIADADCRIVGVHPRDRMVQVATTHGAALEPLIAEIGALPGVVRSAPNRMGGVERPFETSPWAR